MYGLGIFVFFFRKLAILISVVAIVVGASFAYCEFTEKPEYEASASIIVTNGPVVSADDGQSTQKVLGSDIQASLLLADTVVDILETPDIYKYLARKLGSGSDYKQLMSKTSVVRRGEDTMFIDISYRDGDPDKARQIVNLFASASCDYIAEFIPKSNPKIVESADTPKRVSAYTLKTALSVGFKAVSCTINVFAIVDLFRALFIFFIVVRYKLSHKSQSFLANADIM